MLVPAALVAVTLLGACGSDGGDSKAKFADQLQDECRTIARGLRDIDTPSGDDLADFEAAAKDASKVYDTGLTALKKLKAPSNESADFKDLQANISDQVDVFDQIATAAKKDDAATIKTKVASLKKINKDNADLADSLDASSCAFKAVFVDVPTDTKPAKTTTTTTTKATTTTEAPTTTQPPRTYTRDEVAQIIRDVWPDDLEDKAIAIATRESNLTPAVRNACCFGLFQIYFSVHAGWLAQMGVTSATQLYDPLINTQAALALYYRNGGWGPWGG